MQPEEFIPILIIFIPLMAVAGGIAIAVIRAIGQQRLVELAQRERLAAIERGADPARLPPPPSFGPVPGSEEARQAFFDMSRRRAQVMTIAGIVGVFLGPALGVMIFFVSGWSREPAFVGLLPLSIGLGLLVAARVVAPKG